MFARMLKPGLFSRQLRVVWLKLREAARAETIPSCRGRRDLFYGLSYAFCKKGDVTATPLSLRQPSEN